MPLENKMAGFNKQISTLSLEESHELLNELHLHQIELEVQNEEMREIQLKLEKKRIEYENLFDFSPASYFILDLKGIILNVNHSGCKLLGFKQNELIGKPFSSFLANGEKKFLEYHKYIRKTLNTSIVQQVEFQLKTKEKSVFYGQLDGLAEIIENDQVEGIKLIVRDTSEEKRNKELRYLNKSLEREKNTAELYLNIANTIFVMVDLNKKITIINKKGCELLKFKESELIGENWFEVAIREQDRKQLELNFANNMNNRVNILNKEQSVIVNKLGDERLISWNNSLVKDSRGTVLGVLSAGEDITETKMAHLALAKSEKRFRKLFETATEAIITIDQNGEIQTINKTTKQLFGYNKKELIGKNINVLIPHDFQKKQNILFESDLNNSSYNSIIEENIEVSGKKKNGEEFPVEISLSNIKSDEDFLIFVWINDITKRKKAENKLIEINLDLEKLVLERTSELEKSQQLYKMIARNYPNGVINVLDKDLNYVFVDGMELLKKGVELDLLIGTNYLDNFSGSQRIELEKKLKSVFRKKDLNFEINTSEKTVQMSAVGLVNHENEIKQILVVTQDVTKFIRAELSVQKSLKKEQELNELKSRFVSIAAHEFRTPLTSILNSATLLSKYINKDADQDKKYKNIYRIKNSVSHLTKILNDFLSLEKLEFGNVSINKSNLNVPEFFKEITFELRESLKPGQKIFCNHVGENTMIFDHQILKSIVYNVLTNSIKYSSEHSSINVFTGISSNVFTLIVEDKGIGIPKDDLPHLFGRFYRANNVSNIQGTGLGLNIIKKYLDLFHGSINVESEYNKGTLVTIKFNIPKDDINA